MNRAARTLHLGILGGSFNPPHICHLLLAVYARAALGCDEVALIPSVRHPFDKPLVPLEHRLAMCRIMIAGIDGLRVDDVESRAGSGYTIDTLRQLRAELPGAGFSLILGSDIRAETGQWREFERIGEMARVVFVGRGAGEGGFALPDVSSSHIRRNLSAGHDVGPLLHRGVAEYIRRHRLYLTE